jgi:hypothetical protein
MGTVSGAEGEWVVQDDRTKRVDGGVVELRSVSGDERAGVLSLPTERER